MSVHYRVEHETRYVYASSVTTSLHTAHLRPRELPWQHVHSHELRIDPEPASLTQRTDYFSNTATQFQLLQPHTELRVTGLSVVDVRPRTPAIDPARSPAWEDAQAMLQSMMGMAPGQGPGRETSGQESGQGRAIAREPVTREQLEVSELVFASTYVTPTPAFDAFARPSFPPGRPLLDAAIDLMRRIHAEFEFDPAATTVITPVARVLADRRGVCQDFAHLQISCLRALGLAARYVSGYLLTDPPPGQPRLIGADASHAWLSVHCPHHGWVDLDPTNNVIVGTRHVTLAWGRDYDDVTPLRGVLLGGDEHTLTVSVSVVPLEQGS